DPSVVKIGDRWWASATTSNWAQAFPLLSSEDLVHWQLQGHVFNQLPSWADYYFWAPELSYDNGKVYVYYAAHKKGGNLCVGIASADKPEGPYTDHGPLICQEAGSIDAFAMRNENGKLYLVWKEDANSVGKPTPIWAQPLNEERTALTGERTELFRNTEPWEANLVEGVSMTKHGDYFYAFYAAAGCCGAACSYGTGVARSKSLLGPWEKYSKNPLLTGSQKWTCPGHGTPVEKDGRHYFLYHAYDRTSSVFTGREGLLIEYRFTPDGWIEFVKNEHAQDVVPAKKVVDEFDGNTLSKEWQWSVFQQPVARLKNGELWLPSSDALSGTFLGRPTTSANYSVTVNVDVLRSTAASGVAAIGDENNIVYAAFQKGVVKVTQVKEGKEQVLIRKTVPKTNWLRLRMQVSNGKEIRFLYSKDGNAFISLTANAIDGGYLPPWDRAVRAGVVAKGADGYNGVFQRFEMENR
ncbi:MAG TPA: family 43 glycosylhydrolase, partial [Flavisolibacter sp.]|nr:family 43 glycosylhydrolase [Flavisolibacter sp.]